MSNRASGNRFEREMSRTLAENGFWCHVMQQNKAGQPADIIACRGRYHTLIDCKVLGENTFVFNRVEENQRYAMNRFQDRGEQVCWFALKMPDGSIRMLSHLVILRKERNGKKSLSGEELMDSTNSLPEWLNFAKVKSNI